MSGRRGSARPRRVRVTATALAGAALPAVGALPAGAQRSLVLVQPRGTAVSLAVDLNAGGIWDPQAGVSRLAAEALLVGLHARLAALGASGRLDCDRFGLRFTLLAPPSTWLATSGIFLDALFHPAIRPEALDTARARLLRSLHFQQGDPATEIRAAAHEALFGETHRWARGACGRPETVESLTLADAQAAASQRFTPERAAGAIAGPVVWEDALALLARDLGDARLATLLPLPEPPPLPGTREVASPTVTAWVAVVFPLAREPDDEATHLLAYELAEALHPSPDRPHVVDAAAEVERFGGGGALVVYVVADPEEARSWVERVQALVDSAAAAPLDGAAFDLLLRRYRGERLLSLATPEAQAADAADRLFFDHAYVPPAERIAALNAGRLRSAASALGAPAVAYLGPSPPGSSSLDRVRRRE